MELYSPLCGKCVFDRLSFGTIICKKQNTQEITFTSKGYYMLPVFDDCECMIFPSKDQRDWSKFVPPYKFKDGDVCYIKSKGLFEHIFIFKVNEDYNHIQCHVDLSENHFYTGENPVCTVDVVKEIRLATEEEKQKLFDAIKSHGYKWNPETKTLEKLVEPKFKVGDKVRNKNNHNVVFAISSIEEDSYVCGGKMAVCFNDQDDWELVPTKFDVINFEPFMKVLVRSDNSDVWECDFFSLYNPKCSNRFHCIGAWYNICIPYIGNEHLLGTTEDCDDFYKTWE
jgi:hypothetical protein